jgi:hypothetical protein
MKFNIGDRVVVKWCNYPWLNDRVGNVIWILDDGLIGIEFDGVDTRLHSCNGRGEANKCYWVYMDYVKKIIDDVIDDKVEKEEKKMEFKVGDRVIYKPKGGVFATVVHIMNYRYLIRFDENDEYHGWSIPKGSLENREYGLPVDDRRLYWYADEEEIEKVKTPRVRRVVVEITDNGADAKYIVGKNIEKSASIHRFRDDAPDDAKEAQYVIAKLFGVDIKEGEDKHEKEFSEMRDAWRSFKSVIEDIIFDNFEEE